MRSSKVVGTDRVSEAVCGCWRAVNAVLSFTKEHFERSGESRTFLTANLGVLLFRRVNRRRVSLSSSFLSSPYFHSTTLPCIASLHTSSRPHYSLLKVPNTSTGSSFSGSHPKLTAGLALHLSLLILSLLSTSLALCWALATLLRSSSSDQPFSAESPFCRARP